MFGHLLVVDQVARNLVEISGLLSYEKIPTEIKNVKILSHQCVFNSKFQILKYLKYLFELLVTYLFSQITILKKIILNQPEVP